jgi:carboxymethylenebutenolidase
MQSDDVLFDGPGARLRGHLALPASGTGPGLILVPDVRGLSDHYRDVARRFAAEGFVALAVDLYSREGAPDLVDLEAIMHWMAALPDARVLGDLTASVHYLRAQAECRGGIGITGFCMGGQYALLAACTGTPLDACVSWYGMLRYAQPTPHRPRGPLDVAAQLSCPYLGFFGADDALIPLADVDALRTILTRAAKSFTLRTFAGCGHAFFNDTRHDAYRPEAAAESFRLAVAFLHRHLDAL